MKIITMTAWRRPDYFKQVLTALSNCVGVDDYHIIISIDGGYPTAQEEMIEIAENAPLDCEVIAWDESENLGCAENTRTVLENGFSHPVDWVIHLEDDTLPSEDYLQFMEACLENYADNEQIFSICGYQGNHDRDWVSPWFTGDADSVGLVDWFTCWGWGTWRRVWEQLKDDWFGISWNREGLEFKAAHGKSPHGEDFLRCVSVDNRGSWAQPMNHYWREHIGSPYEIKPAVSRIQNIGATDGVFMISEAFHRAKHHTQHFITDLTAINPPDYEGGLDYEFADDEIP